jgi:hypothetical protein
LEIKDILDRKKKGDSIKLTDEIAIKKYKNSKLDFKKKRN